MTNERAFGDWLRQRRRALDLTQEELARQVGCSAVTLRKLEAESRRPSKQIAERLAEVLKVPANDRPAFLRFARGDPFAAPGDSRSSQSTQQPDHPEAPRHNLPIQLTSFIGREKEIEETKKLLAQARLVTLTGAGGSGKTRLALQIANDVVVNFPDGVCLVELARLEDPAFVAPTIGAALGLEGTPGRPITSILVQHLRPRHLLLVLDNCEHVIQASAELTEALLAVCPHLTVLATSRERLDIGGESTYAVGPLSLPDPLRLQSPEALAQSEAGRLFVDRAQRAVHDFELSRANAPTIAQVCQELDGIPLAIELAAARVRVLGVDEIAARLADRFQLLRGGSRTALPRHQTLQALVDWSYNLLSPPEQTLLRRLAVFMGGWTLAAAQDICGGNGLEAGQVLDLLSQLAGKSLINTKREPTTATRYGLLETIRQYALARLSDSDEANVIRERHAAYYLAFTENAQSEAADDRYWFSRLSPEEDNLRAAVTWAQNSRGSAELALRLLVLTADFWEGRGLWRELRRWLEAALARADAEQVQDFESIALAKSQLGDLCGLQGDYAAAQVWFEDALKLRSEQPISGWTVWVLHRLGGLAREHDDPTTARRRLEQSLALCRETGNEEHEAWASVTLGEVMVMQADAAGATTLLQAGRAVFRKLGARDGEAWALNHLGHVAQLQGDYVLAAQRHEESLPLFRESAAQNLGSLGEAWAFHGLGETALARGEAARAAAHLRQALGFFKELGDRSGQSWCLAGLAGVAALEEEPERATRLWGAAEALRLSIGSRPAPASRATRERLMAAAREQLGEDAFGAAWAEGEKLTMEQAVALALADE